LGDLRGGVGTRRNRGVLYLHWTALRGLVLHERINGEVGTGTGRKFGAGIQWLLQCVWLKRERFFQSKSCLFLDLTKTFLKLLFLLRICRSSNGNVGRWLPVIQGHNLLSLSNR
jgi:hypothetical protein